VLPSGYGLFTFTLFVVALRLFYLLLLHTFGWLLRFVTVLLRLRLRLFTFIRYGGCCWFGLVTLHFVVVVTFVTLHAFYVCRLVVTFVVALTHVVVRCFGYVTVVVAYTLLPGCSLSTTFGCWLLVRCTRCYLWFVTVVGCLRCLCCCCSVCCLVGSGCYGYLLCVVTTVVCLHVYCSRWRCSRLLFVTVWLFWLRVCSHFVGCLVTHCCWLTLLCRSALPTRLVCWLVVTVVLLPLFRCCLRCLRYVCCCVVIPRLVTYVCCLRYVYVALHIVPHVHLFVTLLLLLRCALRRCCVVTRCLITF